MPETTNVMTLKITPANRVRLIPSALFVSASKKEIVLRGDEDNSSDIEVSFVKRGEEEEKPGFLFDTQGMTFPLKIGKGQEVRLKILPSLGIKKRAPGAEPFAHDNDDKVSRRADLKIKNFKRERSNDHSDVHIEC